MEDKRHHPHKCTARYHIPTTGTVPFSEKCVEVKGLRALCAHKTFSLYNFKCSEDPTDLSATMFVNEIQLFVGFNMAQGSPKTIMQIIRMHLVYK